MAKTVRTKKKAKTARVKGRQPRTESPSSDQMRWVWGIIMILAGVYCYYAFTTAVPSFIDRIIGKSILMYLFGNTVPILCLVLIGSGILLILDKLDYYKDTIKYILLITLNFMVLLSIYIPNLNVNYKTIDLFTLASYGGYGGIVGIVIAYLLNMLITRTGTLLAVLALTAVEIVMLLKVTFPSLYAQLKDSDFGMTPVKNKVMDITDDLNQKRAVKKSKQPIQPDPLSDLNFKEEAGDAYQIDDSLGLFEDGESFHVDTEVLDFIDDVNEELGLPNRPTPGEKKQRSVKKEAAPEETLTAINGADSLVAELEQLGAAEDEKKKPADSAYVPPSAELLTRPSLKSNTPEKEIAENARRIKETLDNFGVDAAIRGYECGPSITRFEIKPAPGVKVSKIVNLADDLALALATSDIRIEAPIPGRDAVGIEVPNRSSNIVHIREIVDSPEFADARAELPFALGKTLSGHNIIGDIAAMPHLLIAGATGSGKSVCINAIIISLLYHESPEDLKMILIDPKMVELNQYNAIPHLLIPVVTDPRKAAGALNWGIKEMTERYNRFKEAQVRDIQAYNALMDQTGGERLPRIVIIVDELADLMMTSPKEVESAICRIAQLARACGIHLIIATQRPSVDVITGLIKANIPSRIAFSVASNTDSRTILDTSGAEKLLGKGDMLYSPVGLSKPLRVQCCFVSDAEIARVIEAVKPEQAPVYNEDIALEVTEAAEPEHEKKDERRDKLYDDAVEIAFAGGQVSTSMLQRRLGIGYARAGRLIDTLEQDGIISGPNGSKPRKLLISPEEYRSRL